MSRRKLFVYVEDPGAANFVMPMLDGLAEAGWGVELYACRGGLTYLQSNGVQPTAYEQPQNVERFLQEINPQAAFFGTSENLDSHVFDLIDTALALNIPGFGMVDGPANVNARFKGRSSDAFAHVPDYLLLPDEWTADEYAKLGLAQDRLLISGHPYYEQISRYGDELRAQGKTTLRQKYFDEDARDRDIVVFLSERSDGLNAESYTYSSSYTLKGWGKSQKRTHIVLETFLDAVQALDEKPYLVLRMHPQDDLSDYEVYLDHFDHVSTGWQPLDVIYGTDLVVGMTTSLLTEAAIIGLNTMSILPMAAEKDINLAVRDGATPFAVTPTDANALLKFLIEKKQGASSLAKDLVIQNASERVVQFLDTHVSAES